MRTALLDADIVAFKAAAISETKFDWDGVISYDIDEQLARNTADRLVKEYAIATESDRMIVCLTDPKVNFRKQLDPTYKSNRKDTRPPALLMYVKRYLADKYPSYIRPRLEADDIMGILATHPKLIEGEKVIISEDKDMRTIPTLVYNPGYPLRGIQNISELNADRFLLWQAIVGDPTDGYKGAPGVGKKSEWAVAVCEAEREDLWPIILEAFESKGLGPDAAINQVRMAFILRSHAYNFTTKKIKLWQPEWLNR